MNRTGPLMVTIPTLRWAMQSSAAGDVNGDGYDDAIIGGWNYSGAIANCGKAWVFLGGPTGLADSPVWERKETKATGYFAFWVSGGRWDNDGFDDII